MNEPFQLVTNCTFKGKDYLVQMCVLNSKKLELTVTDKFMAEDWQGEYEASYIEALTHKTGNFKQFDVFVIMLKSGLLKTSDCITLDLLTLEDLEHLRCKKILNSHSSSRTNQSTNLNKRYLILTYSVEFDRIHYPLPLDYCGPPNPIVLQNNIRKLESEIERLKKKNLHLTQSDDGDTKKLKEKIQKLLDENSLLTNEIHRLNILLSKKAKPGKNNQALQNSLKKLEEQILYEKNHNQQLILKLKSENKNLKKQVEEYRKSEKLLKVKLGDASRFAFQRGIRKNFKSYPSSENFLDRKRSAPGECTVTQLSSHPVANWNNPITHKSNQLRTPKRSQNRFLSSSSTSDSEGESINREPLRGKKRLARGKKKFPLIKNESRKSSNDRSKHSSEDSKKNPRTLRSGLLEEPKRNSSREAEKRRSLPQTEQNKKECRSRDSSLSSKASSKQSRVSKHSNRGSGDYTVVKNRLPKNYIVDKEDFKFSMSDLETRIHALRKLLSDGLKF